MSIFSMCNIEYLYVFVKFLKKSSYKKKFNDLFFLCVCMCIANRFSLYVLCLKKKLKIFWCIAQHRRSNFFDINFFNMYELDVRSQIEKVLIFQKNLTYRHVYSFFQSFFQLYSKFTTNCEYESFFCFKIFVFSLCHWVFRIRKF